MNPLKVDRNNLNQLTDLPNIGKSIAADLELLGINSPNDLIDRDPFQLYDDLRHVTHSKHDPCVLDVFMSITRFMRGEAAKPWWEYTAERKQLLSDKQK